VDGWKLLRDFPTILFGDGGSMKSFLGLYVAGRLAQQGTRVLLLDWELDGEDHSERLHHLFGSEVPTDVFYLRAEAPLVEEAATVAREIKRRNIEYLISDSVGLATDGPPEQSEQALNYFRTLRSLGVRGSLGIAHVTKGGDAADQRPFGSAFWHHLARMTWFVKRETSEPGRQRVRLLNRKTNLTEALPSIRLEFSFDQERIAVSRVEGDGEDPRPSEVAHSIRQRMVALIRKGGGQPMTVPAIAEALMAKVETVARTVRRNDCFVRLPSPDGEPRIGLRDQRTL
jgi:hypothetical protein